MTENGTWTEEHDLWSDVWGNGKSMGPMTPEEELEAWRATTRMLDGQCTMADGLMLEPLILALGDAIRRSSEELRRAEDRLSRPEGADPGAAGGGEAPGPDAAVRRFQQCPRRR